MSDARRVRSLATVLVAMAVMTLLGRTATSGASYTARSASPTGTITAAIDWTPPTVTLIAPPPIVRGTITLAANAADAETGVARVELSAGPTTTKAWSAWCASTASPWACAVDTTTRPDGVYDVRAVAIDGVGLTAESVVTGIRVDNTPPAPTLTLPPAPLAATLSATGSVAEAGSGLASVELLRAPTGSTTWTASSCTLGSTATCHLNTTQVPDGIHDFSLRATDLAGNVGQSTIVTREIRNAPVRAVDIQAAGNGNSLLGSGDVFFYTYSHVIAPGSLLSGWDGSPRSVVVRTTNNRVSGRASDHIDVYTDNSWRTPIQVGTLELGADVMSPVSDDLTFNGTIAAETVTVGGRPATRIRLNVGTWRLAGLAQPVLTSHQMTWYPSAAARDLFNIGVSPTPVVEPGPADNDL